MATVTPIEPTEGGEPPTDAELIGGVSASDPEALERLFRRHVRLVQSIAQRILNDRAEAEDVTQEIFFEIFRKAHLYQIGRGSFRTWLLQYVYHRTLRRKATLRRRAAYAAEPVAVVDERVPARPPRLTPEECRWVLRSGFAQLTDAQRMTLELTCFEDLPLREVAQRLGVSMGCTRHHYYRGLARLRRWARASASPDAMPPDEPVQLVAR